jgi:hypothetical protein
MSTHGNEQLIRDRVELKAIVSIEMIPELVSRFTSPLDEPPIRLSLEET